MNLELADKVAIVTGSSRGLGLASARALAAEGCRLVLCARGHEALHAAAASVAAVAGLASAGGQLRLTGGTAAGAVEPLTQPVAAGRQPDIDRVLAVAADVSTAAGAELVVTSTIERFGRLDVLVNNVGKAGGGGVDTTSDEEWQSALDQTLYPAIRMSRLAVPHMRRAGGGVILMIASIWGRESGGRMTYNAVKAAEISLAKAMAQQLAKDNIRVNSLAPGSISFEGGTWWTRQQQDPEGMAAFVAREIPMGRFGRAEEVGDVVAFLASARASWITGACIPVDGGQGRSNV
jgi:3-oxoacyl-[acyl-carrier protein] reductase